MQQAPSYSYSAYLQARGAQWWWSRNLQLHQMRCNAYGMGSRREAELHAACKVLQVPSSHVRTVDDDRLQDGMRTSWDTAAVVTHVTAAMQQFKPTMVVTFDNLGVSHHPNHVAVHHGVRCEAGALSYPPVEALECADILFGNTQCLIELAYAAVGSRRHAPSSICYFAFCTPSVAQESVATVPKFIGGIAVLSSCSEVWQPSGSGRRVFVATEFWRAWKAMTRHRSQLVWYRWLFMVASRYTYINTLTPLASEATEPWPSSANICIGESKWRPLELCHWPDQGALPAKGKQYPGLGYQRVRDKPPKAQQQQQPAEA
ncbi:hypothetical protein QJQ45_008276 [Haematococcus lacustris]|nr:hypothetical protein QJQ45_008276 [Haematococcus lacustris]